MDRGGGAEEEADLFESFSELELRAIINDPSTPRRDYERALRARERRSHPDGPWPRFFLETPDPWSQFSELELRAIINDRIAAGTRTLLFRARSERPAFESLRRQSASLRRLLTIWRLVAANVIFFCMAAAQMSLAVIARASCRA